MALDQIDVDKAEEKNMSFLDHIEELRWHIVRSVIAILLGAIVCFIFGTFIFDEIIFGPVNKDFWTYRQICSLSHLIYDSDKLCFRDLDFKTQNISLSGQLIQHLVVAIIGGIIMAFPIILYEIWRFVRPALQDTERKKTTGIVLVSSFLFFVGVLFGYFGLTPLSVNFLFNYSVSSKIVNNVTLESYISFVTMMTLATGLVFELPLMIYFLARLGLVTPALLRKYRKHSLIVTLVLAAVITPPDVASQVLMSIPIYILYEIGILVADRVEKGKNTINIIND
jgi:sec-independent protein translocase protein TatC